MAVSAGSWHSCGVRSAGTIVCWGYSDLGLLEAPDGEFQAVSAGHWHSCGLRADRTLSCWGSNDDWNGDHIGQAIAPAGEFVAVSAGRWHSCGLRSDQTIGCWGWQSFAPGGRFQSVSAGGNHSCGLRTDETVDCWGHNSSGETVPPAGEFLAVSAGGSHSCGLRTDRTVECWGSNDDGQSTPPAGEFQWVSAGDSHSCGLRADQSVECWGFTRRPFTGSFEVHVFYCASESLGYSDADLEREVEEMSNVTQFFARQSSGLASVRFIPAAVISPDVDWDGILLDTWLGEVGSHPCQEEIEEWGDAPDVLVLTGAKPGGLTSGYAFWGSDYSYAAVSTLEARYASYCPGYATPHRVRDLGGVGSCPISTANLIEQYENVVLHEIGHSVFKLDHPLDCSFMSYICNDNSRMGCAHIWLLGWPPPDECPTERSDEDGERSKLLSISPGLRHYCGLRADGTIDCWGWNNDGQAEAPGGAFTALSAGFNHNCGLRVDGTVQCWGDNSHGQIDAPTGTFIAIRANHNYSCATRADGTTQCWGDRNTEG